MKYSYTKETEKEALKLFDSGKQIKEISEILNLTKSTARLLILRNSRIPILRAYQYQKVNTNPFNKGTEESYYWLGYFLADGWITTKKNEVGICSMTDPEHLEKFKNLIGNITTYKKQTPTGIIHRIVFGNKETREYLDSIGIVVDKSNKLKLNIPLNRHMLRGVFDGDGSISQNIPKITSGSIEFCLQIQQLLEEYNIKCIIGLKDKKKKPCYDVRIKGDDRFRFYKLLYEDSTIFLARKKNKYRSALKQFKVKNIGLIAGILPYIHEAISSQD